MINKCITVTIITIGLLTVPAVFSAKEKADPVKGKQLYTQHCAACHQAEGAGKAGFAPSIANADFLAGASNKFIKKTVKKGRPGTSMVPRPDLVKDNSLKHIIAYLRSVNPRQTPSKIKVDESKKIWGNPDDGKELFAAYCAGCHGPNGEGYSAGGSGPAIGLKGLWLSASDDFVFQTIKYGRRGTAMRSFSGGRGLAHLTDEQINNVVAYLRQIAR